MVENCEIFYTPPVYLPLQRMTPSNVWCLMIKMFDRMIGLPRAEKLWRYVSLFRYNTGNSPNVMDRHTELLCQYRAGLRCDVQITVQYMVNCVREPVRRCSCSACRWEVQFVGFCDTEQTDYISKWGEFCCMLSKFAQNFLTTQKLLKCLGIPNWESRLPQFPEIPDREFPMTLSWMTSVIQM